MKKLIVVILLASVIGCASVPQKQEMMEIPVSAGPVEIVTGAEWLEMERTEKLAFIEGYMAGIVAAGNALNELIGYYFNVLMYSLNMVVLAEQAADSVDAVLATYPDLEAAGMDFILIRLGNILAQGTISGGVSSSEDEQLSPKPGK